jgi:hypothetical protein
MRIVNFFAGVTEGARQMAFFCPGCKMLHELRIDPSKPSQWWSFDGNYELPTIHPSINRQWPTDQICHSWVRAGRIEFLADTTHALSGQTVDLPELVR